MFVIGSVRSVERDPSILLKTVLSLRKKPNVPIYLPGIAKPSNLATIVFSGIDLVDDTACIIHALDGIYFTRDEELPLSDVSPDIMCGCEACIALSRGCENRTRLLYLHNLFVLKKEMEIIRYKLVRGKLREYVEGKTAFSDWNNVFLSTHDEFYDEIEPFVHVFSKTKIFAGTDRTIKRVEIRRFVERLKTRYEPKGEIALFLPCSAKKPYSLSRTHRIFRSITEDFEVSEFILTSPLGVVPRELEMVYPASHYEIPISGVWSECELQWLSQCVADITRRGDFKHVVVHAEGGFAEGCKRAEEILGDEFIYTSKGNATSKESLSELRNVLESIANPKKKAN